MIKFHYHTARTGVARLEVEEGDRLCHVYSDRSRAELVAWGRSHDLRPEWIDDGHALPHYDVKVADFEDELGPGVERAELVADIRAWRDRRRQGPDSGGQAGLPS